MSETSVAAIHPERRECPHCKRETEHWVTDMTEGDNRVIIRTCLTCRREIVSVYERTSTKAE